MVKSSVIALVSCLSLTAQAADWDFLKNDTDSQLYVKSYSGVLLGSQTHHNDSSISGSSIPAINIRCTMASASTWKRARPSAPAASNPVTT